MAASDEMDRLKISWGAANLVPPARPASKVIDLIVDDDEMSNDTDIVEYVDSVDEDEEQTTESRPIMYLLRCLIRNKQNTVMTNAQIIDILDKEFSINVHEIHELEVDIYIKIIKKYLKDWPQWEELERISTKLSKTNDSEAIAKVLDHKYKNMKEFLGVMLEAAKPLASQAVKSVTVAPESSKPDDNPENDVIMEIQCTRQQLNHLFFRKPRLDLNNTVFNMSPEHPTQISLRSLSFHVIFSYLPLKISVNAPGLSLTRELLYNLKHVLVNKARVHNSPPPNVFLNTGLQVRTRSKGVYCNKNYLLNTINEILEKCKNKKEDLFFEAVVVIFDTIIRDLKSLPKMVVTQAPYRRYMNKYKYVRHLFVENTKSKDDRYDLQLEETLAPMYQFQLKKMPENSAEKPQRSWFKVECTICAVKFTVSNFQEEVVSHYTNCHQNDPDWQCMNCKKIFSVEYLSKFRFRHQC
ncbi:unnamed protein product [Chrysodeixis includens]|uniref:Uncharacterized protein n=1 Tax=Chrysodeixis includens TaxID=689277 RepID=A0A9P0FUZ0_CHRIL|nr:unnamed protein product [Chrysodeixis includens]